MRILHINPFFHPYTGGTENYIHDLSKHLTERGHEVSVLTSQLENTSNFEVVNGIRVHRVRSIVLKNLPGFLPPPYSIPVGFAPALFRVCRKEKPDIVHLHNRFFLNFASVALWKRFLHIPLFLSLHNSRPRNIDFMTDLLGAQFDNYVGNIIIRSADFVIGNSKDTLNATAPFVPDEKKTVIYNGIDTSVYYRRKSNFKQELGCDFLSTTVCRLQEQKGLRYLIGALKQVEVPGFKAAVIGGGPERARLEALAHKLGVQDKVAFLGKIPHEKLLEANSAGDAFVLPSLYEPFGIALLEAMACGTPCIGARAGGIPEVIGDTGIIVEPRNSRQIADAINRLGADSKLRDKLGKAALERAKKVFEWDIISKQVEKCYKDFLERNGKR